MEKNYKINNKNITNEEMQKIAINNEKSLKNYLKDLLNDIFFCDDDKIILNDFYYNIELK